MPEFTNRGHEETCAIDHPRFFTCDCAAKES
jgi:hypothetical protein